MRFLLGIFLMLMSVAAQADEFVFENIDGGVIDLRDYKGKAVLVVNTASRCGFTRQYAGLQKLFERYHEDGLVVLAVPSHDFKQELKEDELVKQFCEINYGLTLPMTSITKIKGTDAHPFFAWLKREHGFSPSWNFNKVLLDGDGEYVASFGSTAGPTGRRITKAVQSVLARL